MSAEKSAEHLQLEDALARYVSSVQGFINRHRSFESVTEIVNSDAYRMQSLALAADNYDVILPSNQE
jgi:hypothetical protein